MKIEKLKINIFRILYVTYFSKRNTSLILLYFMCKKIYLFQGRNSISDSNLYIYRLHHKKRATFIPDYYINYILLTYFIFVTHSVFMLITEY